MGAEPSPLIISVQPHPFIANRFTHSVAQADARARGWLVTGDAPLGVWRTRSAARRAALRLQAQGIVNLRRDA